MIYLKHVSHKCSVPMWHLNNCTFCPLAVALGTTGLSFLYLIPSYSSHLRAKFCQLQSAIFNILQTVTLWWQILHEQNISRSISAKDTTDIKWNIYLFVVLCYKVYCNTKVPVQLPAELKTKCLLLVCVTVIIMIRDSDLWGLLHDVISAYVELGSHGWKAERS